MSKAVRMADIAERLGVSTVTVSKALAGKEGVSDVLRERVKQTAEDMGYHHGNQAVRRKKGSGNIGVLIPAWFLEKNNSFYWEMYQRLVTRLASKEYYGILEVISPGGSGGESVPRLLQNAKVDGIIVLGQVDKAYIRFLRGCSTVPIMFLDSYDESNGNDSIISDGYYGMFAMTNHLIQQGHRDICFVGRVGATSSISDRYFGFCRAMQEHGLPVTPDKVLPDRGPDGTIHFDLPQKLPTAFACNCDMTAYTLADMLEKRGLQVPADISLVGFDNYQLAVSGFQELTTYAVDMDGMARSCVERLIRKINNPGYVSNLKVVSGHIVVRNSVRRLEE